MSARIDLVDLVPFSEIAARLPDADGSQNKIRQQMGCPPSALAVSAESVVLRLRKRTEFLAVQAGEKRRGRYFLLELRQRSPLDGGQMSGAPRIGFTVSRKNGNAVRRNRIRRRLREAVRLGAADCLEPGYDYVIVARPDVLTLPFDRLIDEMRRRFQGLGKVPGKHVVKTSNFKES